MEQTIRDIIKAAYPKKIKSTLLYAIVEAAFPDVSRKEIKKTIKKVIETNEFNVYYCGDYFFFVEKSSTNS